MRDTLLFRKAFGAMIGGAIGDATGGPCEGLHYRDILKIFGEITGPIPYRYPMGAGEDLRPGAYTDDTVLKHIWATAIGRAGGRITAYDAAPYFLKFYPERANQLWWTEKIAYCRLLAGKFDARKGGAGNIPCDDAAMSAVPFGIVNACNPWQAAQDAYDVCSIIQDGYSLYSAAAVAAAIAEGMKRDATIDSIVLAAIHHTDRLNRRAILRAAELGKGARGRGRDEFIELLYQHVLVEWQAQPDDEPVKHPHCGGDVAWSFSADPLEVVPAAFAFFVWAEGDAKQAIPAAAHFGRDCDTVAGLVGAFCGVLKGYENIPAEWIELSLETNPEPDMRILTEQLCQAASNVADGYREMVDSVQGLVEARYDHISMKQ